MSRIPLVLGAPTLLLLLLAGCSKPPDGPPAPLTIVLISIDTCRADALGCYGRKLSDGSSPTPVIDGLIGGNHVFAAHTPVPLTLPAHTTMLSGLYPDHHGVRENDSFKVPKRENRKYTLLAEDLKAAGFQTAAFVSAQPLERRFGLDAGFDVYDQPDPKTARGGGQRFRERRASETAAKVISHVKAGLAAKSFLFVHFFDPHAPYEPEVRSPALPPGVWGDYLGEVMAVDRAIGEIMAALPNGGRDAWIIVTADHGEGLGDHGEASHGLLLYDSTLRIPLGIREPRESPLRPDYQPAGLIDVYPTILQIAGIGAATGRDGWPLVCGKNTIVEHAVRSARAETLYGWYQFRYARLRACWETRDKLIEGGGKSELYDLATDLAELKDLAASKPDEVARLKKLLVAALAVAPAAQAPSVSDVPDVAGPYFGGRPPSSAVEPSEDENAKLAPAQDRWKVIDDLEEARAALRRGEASNAVLLLNQHEVDLTTNPALLFWTARAHQELGQGKDGSKEARLAELDEAARLYREVKSRFGDPRGLDSELLVLRARHGVTTDQADLKRLVALATGEITASGGTALTFALRGVAKRDLGDTIGADGDLAEAAKRDPENPRIAADLADLRQNARSK